MVGRDDSETVPVTVGVDGSYSWTSGPCPGGRPSEKSPPDKIQPWLCVRGRKRTKS